MELNKIDNKGAQTLSERLAILSKAKNDKIELEKHENLQPIKDRIKQIQESIDKLISLRQNINENVQIQDKLLSDLEIEKQKLNTVFEDNKEVLQDFNVLSLDDLIKWASTENGFKDTEEMIAYNSTEKAVQDLHEKDSAIHQNLKDLDAMDQTNEFSYDLALVRIDEKIKELNLEINKNELQIPEERQKVLDLLIKEFGLESSKKAVTFNETYPDSREIKLNMAGKSFSYNFEKGLVENFSNLRGQSLIDQAGFSELENVYGAEIANEALETVYQYSSSVHEAVMQYDEKVLGTASLMKQMESISPEARTSAEASLQEFKSAQDLCKQTIVKVEQFLAEKGIEFKLKTYLAAYGEDKIEWYIGLTSYDTEDARIAKIPESDKFPPDCNFTDLNKKIEKRLKVIQEFTEEISKLSSLQAVEEFNKSFKSGSKSNPIYKVHLDSTVRDVYKFEFKIENSNHTALVEELKNKKSYEETEKFLQDKMSKLTDAEKAVLKKIERLVKEEHLLGKIKSLLNNDGGRYANFNLRDLEYALENIVSAEKHENNFNTFLANLDAKLADIDPNSELKIEQFAITIPSIETQKEVLKKEISTLRTGINDKVKLFQEKKEPKKESWGFTTNEWKNWDNEKLVLENTNKELEVQIKEKEEGYTKLNNQSPIGIPDIQSFSVFWNGYAITGTKSHIIESLRARIPEAKTQGLPLGVRELFEEYKEVTKEKL